MHRKPQSIPFGMSSGKSAAENLRYMMELSEQKLASWNICTASKVRYRGDMLELFLDAARLNSGSSSATAEARIYRKNGLLLSTLKHIMKASGLKPVLRTFPRFDEPLLVAYVYHGSDKLVSRQDRAGTYSNCLDEYMSCRAKKRSLEIHEASRKEHARILSEMPEFTSRKPRRILLITAKRNTPVTWISSGLFMGDALHHAERLGRKLIPVLPDTGSENLKNLPEIPEDETLQLILLEQ